MSQQHDPLGAARILVEKGRLLEAEESCLSILRRQPNDIGALRLSAHIACRTHREALAVALLMRAMRVMPSDGDILAELGRLLIDQRKPAEALAVLQQPLGTHMASAQIHHLRGVAFRDLKHLDEAEAALRSALALEPGRAMTHECLADLLRAQGRLRETQHHLEISLQLCPNSLPTLVALADSLTAQREYAAGIALLREAEAKAPDPAPIWARIGVALKDMGDSQGALDALTAAVTRNPHSPEAHYYLADAQLTFGYFVEAAQNAKDAVRLSAGVAARELWAAALAGLGDLDGAINALRAGDSPARSRNEYVCVLGNRLARAGARDQALECFRLLIQDDPTDLDACHAAAALRGQVPDHPSPEYVRRLFDNFATSFDERMVGELGYSGPRELKRALIATSTRNSPWEVMDLGCGTGLVARELAGLIAHMDGVDISPNMIERARECKLYRNLTCSDLLAALQPCALNCYDVVVAADVFIYVGKLDAVIAAARKVLRPGGMLAFTAEVDEGSSMARLSGHSPGFRLESTGRYTHSVWYLETLAAQNDFTVPVQRQIWLRREFGRPVAAWLGVWTAGG